MKKNFKKVLAAVLCMVTVWCAAMPASYAAVNGLQAVEYDSAIESVAVEPMTVAGIGATTVIKVKAYPADAAEGRFVIASLSDGAAATIRNPELIFNKNGEANFEVTALSDEDFEVYFNVADSVLSVKTAVETTETVSTNRVDDPDIVEVTDIYIDTSSKTLIKGETFTIGANVLPLDATNQNIIWTSNKKSVARVDRNGVVTAVSKGSAWIIATSEDGGFNAICYVTVKNRSYNITWYVEGAKYAESIVEEGAVITKPTNPTKLGYNFVGWQDENLQLTTVPTIMPGHNLKFYAYFEKVTVTEPVESNVKINILPPSRYAINYGDSLILQASVTGTLKPGMMVIWNVNNDDLFTLDVDYGARTCRVIPERNGTTEIYALVIDENENVIASDVVVMTSRASFFYKILGIIKGWFGLTTIYLR